MSPARWSARASSCLCLIGGATTSRAHTAIKIAPHYSEPVVHVLDASRAVPVTTSLLSEEGKPAFVAQHLAEYEASAQDSCGSAPNGGSSRDGAKPGEHRLNGAAEDIPAPSFTGVRVLDNFPLAELRDFIDWSPLFHTWGLKGIYPRILEHESYGAQARQVFARGQCPP